MAVVLLFEVLNEENSFEEFSTDSESALVSKVGNIGFDGYIGTCIFLDISDISEICISVEIFL